MGSVYFYPIRQSFLSYFIHFNLDAVFVSIVYSTLKLGIMGLEKRRTLKSITDGTERARVTRWIKRAGSWSTAAGVQAGK